MPLSEQEEQAFSYDSRTMTAEQILADLEKMEGVEGNATTRTYSDPDELHPARTPDPAPNTNTTSPVPPEASGETAVEDKGSETAAEPGTAEPQKVEEKKEGGFQRKLKKAQAENGTLKSTLAERDRELAELKARLEGKPAEKPAETKAEAKAPEPATEDPEPQPEDFDDYGLYMKAAARWTVRDERRQEQQRETERTQQAEAARKSQEAPAKTEVDADQAEREERWNDSLEEARERYPDLDEVFSKPHPELVDDKGAPRAMCSGVMWEQMKDEEDGVDIGYWLATHPQESARIAELTGLTEKPSPSRVRQAYSRATLEFDKIRAQIASAPKSAAPQPPAEKPAAAVPPPAAEAPPANPIAVKKPLPAPIKPLGSTGTGAKTLRDMTDAEVAAMDFNEYNARLARGEGS